MSKGFMTVSEYCFVSSRYLYGWARAAILMQSIDKVLAGNRIPGVGASGATSVTVTSAESNWLMRVMRAINNVADEEPCLAPGRSVQEGAAEDVLRAAQSFIKMLKEPE